MTTARVLFVDDEPRILDGIRRSLRGKRREWDMAFAPGGEDALELLAGSAFDVVVSDMRMPGIDGAELLTRVSERHPEVARVVLSGHTEPAAAIKVALAGHRFLTKPTETEALVSVIEELVVRTSRGHGGLARRIAGATRALPALPQQKAKLDALLAAPQVDLAGLVHAVGHDTSLTAKLLQLSNWGFFGARPRNTSVAAVVNTVGVPTIQALVAASEGLWSAVTWQPAAEESALAAWRHAIACAALVDDVASPAHRPHAHAAAVLQDIGRLMGVGGGPTAADPAADAHRAGDPGGVPYREIGVELLHLWGLPSPIVAAVAERDTAHRPAESGLAVTGAVRAAHLLIQRTESRDPADGAHSDELRLLLAHPQLAAQSVDWARAADEASAQAGRWLGIET
ncbi:MAG TPA: HDOD domain-containing protein [Pilimelia sp.]|nr:HDOD domain-containing protein [Pilimelia sp.]